MTNKQLKDIIEMAGEAMRGIRTDSLGRGTVFYFPGVPADGLRFEEAEDEGDAPGEGNPAQWR